MPLLVFEFPGENAELNPIIFLTINHEPHEYSLKGIIYYGEHHFTSHILSSDNIVWYHDGMTTGPHMINEGPPTLWFDVMQK